jgi:hypothetical protein
MLILFAHDGPFGAGKSKEPLDIMN